MKKPSLGQQELDVLRYVTDHAPLTVAEAAEQFGVPRSLARTTILTMMERLRKKGYLTREKVDGIFRYSPSLPKAELMRGLVQNFMTRTLDGSIEPFVAYLSQDAKLSDSELDELKTLVSDLEAKRKG